MSIILMLGNVGSCKTASMVREMVLNPQRLKYYSNIHATKPKKTPQMLPIDSSMIIQKEIEKYVNKRDGSQEPVYKYAFNKEFWQSINEPISVVLDEFHTLMNSRRPGSRVNIIMGDFLAMLRRVLGEDPMVEGDLFLITQLGRRSDIIAREMAHQIRYHIGHYVKRCNKCKFAWRETSEDADKRKICPRCFDYRLTKSNHVAEVLLFEGISKFDMWKEYGMNSYYRRYYINDISHYFQYYNSWQWDALFSDLY